MPPAIIGGAIAAVGAVTAAVVSNRGASSAAKATVAGAKAGADALTVNYDKSAAALAPWQQQGLQANSLLNSGLGIGGQPPPPQQTYGFPSGEAAMYGRPTPYGDMGGMQNDIAYGPNQMGENGQAGFGGEYAMPQQAAQNTMGNVAAPNGAPSAYAGAFGNWLANSDYGFQFAQGTNAVNSGYAGAGTLQSGAAIKGIEDYRQNLQKGYRGEYNALLGNQQQLGYGAASAQAGVSQGLGNNLANIAVNQGQNMAAVAAAKSNATGQAINSLATIGAGIFGQQSGGQLPLPVAQKPGYQYGSFG